MADDLRARLKGLIGKTVTEEDMQDLAVAIADALDAAPPPERVLPEGLRWATCAACEGKGYKRVAWSGGSFPTPTTFRDEKCWACHCTGLVVCRPALSPDSGADPEPQRVIVDFAEVEPDPKPDLMAALKDSIDKAREARRWKCVAPELVSHGVRLAAKWTLHATETDAREAADAYENGHVEHLRDDGEWVRVADPKDGTDG